MKIWHVGHIILNIGMSQISKNKEGNSNSLKMRIEQPSISQSSKYTMYTCIIYAKIDRSIAKQLNIMNKLYTFSFSSIFIYVLSFYYSFFNYYFH